MSNHSSNRAILFACSFVFLFTSACSPFGTYLKDRAMDVTDLVDLKYSAPRVLGLGVKVEATDNLGAGFGFALGSQEITEWYGRRFTHEPGGVFFHLVAFGMDEAPTENVDEYATRTFLAINRRRYRPPFISLFRFGGEFLLPGVHFGLYVNVGEVLDFMVGFVTLDPAEDDGVAKGSTLDLRPSWGKNMYGEYTLSVEKAIEYLRSVKVAERRVAASTLGGFPESPHAITALIRVLKDMDHQVRMNAAESLKKITGQDFGIDEEGWRTWWEEQGG